MNHSLLNRWSLSIAILGGLTASHTSWAAPPEKPQDKVFVGYLFGQPRDINFQLYTHICHAFLVADGEGKVRTGRNVPSRELTGKAHQAGVKVLVSLGGWGWDGNSRPSCPSPKPKTAMSKSVMAIVDENDYDGIDLDWEYPTRRRKSSASSGSPGGFARSSMPSERRKVGRCS